MSCHENSMLSVKELMIIIAFNLFFSHIFQYFLALFLMYLNGAFLQVIAFYLYP